jgi:hypothetical protein
MPLRLLRIGELELNTRAGRAILDGKPQEAKVGCWMFYLPALQAKLFHADSGRIDCIHPSRPDAATLAGPDRAIGRYRLDDWRSALATPLARRLAEIWLVSARLWKAGLGPQPLGVCFVDRFVRDGRALGPTCGILSQNVFRMPRKRDGTLEQVRQADVIPDRILSCVRQQVRGYVIDLCSVVGCMPADAEEDVARLETCLRNPPTDAVLLAELENTLR